MRKYCINILFVLLCVNSIHAQEKKTLRIPITYLAASVVYIDAGREQQIAVGDTLVIFHTGKEIGRIVVTAISKKSSAAQIVTEKIHFAVGDEAVISKEIIVEKKVVESSPVVDTSSNQKTILPSSSKNKITSNENIVSGRAGLQYNGVIAEDSRFNIQQPSALLRLDVQNLIGSGIVLSFYGRSNYDATKNTSVYGGGSGLKHRIYEFSLQRDLPDASYGYGVGRMTSRFVGGMGTFDGFQVFFRYDNFTAGFLGGAQVVERSLSFNNDETKGSLFLNYQYGKDFYRQYDGTIAYGRQMVKSNLDREFLYLQNSFSLNSELSLYESTEIELNDINNGVRSSAFKLSNTFLLVNYYPLQWLSTTLGYDATRSIYLFETMKLLSISDTLFDKNLLQGYRANFTIRLPYFISFSGNASIRLKDGFNRDAQNLGASLRMNDIGGTEINAGVRYANILGTYSDGNNITVDIDRTFFYNLSTSLRYDFYKYSVTTLKQTYTTHTFTANVYYRMSRIWYTSLSVDDVIDQTMNSYRIFAEIGIRF